LPAIISKALEKDREQRYQSAAEISVALTELRMPKRARSVSIGKPAAIATVTVVVLLLLLGIYYWRARHSASLSANDTLVLADVTNRTSDPVLDDALNTAMRVEFEQTSFFNTLAPDKVYGTLAALHRPMNQKITPELAREICQHTNSKALITSSIADEGNRYLFEMQGIDCPSGRSLASMTANAATRDQIIHVLGLSGERMRRELGEPAASVRQFSKPLEIATSSSPEALQFLTEGFRHHLSRDDLAISYYQRAIDTDPNLALAYLAMAARYSHTAAQSAEAAATVKKAFDLRDRLTGSAGFLAETLYYCIGTGELEKAIPVYQRWTEMFPTDIRGRSNFSTTLRALGRSEESVEMARQAVRLAPSVSSYFNLVFSLILAEHPKEAAAALDDAQSLGIDGDDLHYLRGLIAFLLRDDATRKKEFRWAVEKGTDRDPFIRETDTLAYYGRFREARASHEKGLKIRTAEGVVDPAQDFGLDEIEVGNLSNGRRLAESAATGVRNFNQRVFQAFFFARAGEIDQATQLADDLDRNYPLDSLLQRYSLPAIRAAIKLQQNDPAAAVEILRVTQPYDLAIPEAFNSLYPAYLRGLAFLRMGNGHLAAAEFQNIIAHPGTVGRSMNGSLAKLQLARALAMSGDKVAARKTYEEFLALWNNADARIPVYREAKEEYSRLK
jgi:tetratricopeptide (TPR) repeat protein